MASKCIECRKGDVKPLRKEERPRFCSRKCAVSFAVKEAAKRTGCPKCGSTFYHKTRDEYGWGGDYVCEECNHSWESK